jgi:hypothetical protein
MVSRPLNHVCEYEQSKYIIVPLKVNQLQNDDDTAENFRIILPFLFSGVNNDAFVKSSKRRH